VFPRSLVLEGFLDREGLLGRFLLSLSGLLAFEFPLEEYLLLLIGVLERLIMNKFDLNYSSSLSC